MVIVMQGNEIKMLVEGDMRSIIPFVGCVRQKELLGPKAVELSDPLTIGIGFCFRDTITDRSGDFWIPPKPMLISCWRAIAFLRCLKKIEHNTFNACWSAAGDLCKRINSIAIEVFENQFTSQYTIYMARKEILNSVPTTKELDAMLQIVLKNNIKIDGEELRSLVDQGKLTKTPMLDNFIKEQQTTQIKE